MSLFGRIHYALARLHGADPAGVAERGEAETDFISLYADYADATARAAAALRRHGKNSRQFIAADIASMRLFHRAKKAQGFRKPKKEDDDPERRAS